MPTPYLAPSLVRLRDEVDARWPHRGKAADGWIGDARHQAEKSEHNPDNKGCVHAIDITTDGSIDADWLADQLVAAGRRGPATWYVIHNRIIRSRTYGWASRAYSGADPHTGHIHISIELNSAAENWTGRWLPDPTAGGPSRGAGVPLPLPSTPPRHVPEEDDLMLIPAGTAVTLPVPEAAPGTIRRLYIAATPAADVSVIFRQGVKVTRAMTWHIGDGQSAMASLTATNTAIGGLPTSVSISARTPVVAVIATVPA